MTYGLLLLSLAASSPKQNVSSLFNDPPPRTKYAYISGYTGDDAKSHFFALAVTCGYSLMKTSPDYDRILLVPTDLHVPEEKMRYLKQVWTHIIKRPYLRWPDGYVDTHARDMFLWFKLNAWSVVGYTKLLWTGIDVVFRRDPSLIFDFPAPCSVVDHYVYGMSHLGPVTNGDFLLFRPSLRDFAGLKKLGMRWSRDPGSYGMKLIMKGASWTGPHDQGLITQYYDGNITTAPQWYQLEVPGSTLSILGYNNTDNPDPRIVSFHFPSTVKPWKKTYGVFPRVWSNFANEAFDFLGLPYDYEKYGFAMPGPVHKNLMFLNETGRPAEPAEYVDNEDGIDPTLLFPPTLFKRRQKARIFFIFLFCNLLMCSYLFKVFIEQEENSTQR